MAELQTLAPAGGSTALTRKTGVKNPALASRSEKEGLSCGGRVAALRYSGHCFPSSSGPTGRVHFEKFRFIRRCCVGVRRIGSRSAQSGENFGGNGIRDKWSAADQTGGNFEKVVGMFAVVLTGLGFLYGEDAAMASLVPARFPWEKAEEQVEPSRGTCATCIGVVDETLGTCDSTANCVSSFDDRPRFFVAPWEFPGKLTVAVQDLKSVLTKSGGSIEEQGERYLHAVYKSKDGFVDDVEFLFSNPREDKTVVLRSASRAPKSDDKQRNRDRLEAIRKALAWEQVPILRSRQRKFFFLESPWDTFGPEPPPSYDYKENLQYGND